MKLPEIKLTEQFLEKYRALNPFPNSFSEFIYLRTYSRWLDKLSRRESWVETCKRCVEYSFSLYSGSATQETLLSEAHQMFDDMFYVQQLPSGRTLWMGGTEIIEKIPTANYNCFRSDTKFLTSVGYKSFSDFQDGDSVVVLSRGGFWKEASVKNFGKEKLFKISLKKGRSDKEIYATENHRWIVLNGDLNHAKTLKTSELSYGDKMHESTARVNKNYCKVGLQHGMVFGDGTFVKKTGCTSITMHGDSVQFLDIFTTGTKIQNSAKGGDPDASHKVVDRLPWNWKQLPSLAANKEYLLGFLIGWFGADGNMSGTTSLSSASIENLEWAKSAFAIVGMKTGAIRLSRETSPFDGSDKPLYSMTVSRETLFEEFFIKDTHLQNYKKKELETQNKPTRWSVVSVEETNIVEDVWCVQEPSTETFTLEDSILTHNCSFTVIDDLEAFHDLFYLLMVGCGVGFSVEKKYVSKLPLFNSNVTLDIKPYKWCGCPVSPEQTEVQEISVLNDKINYIVTIGDSREGWAKGVQTILELMTKESTLNISVIMDYVRPQGARLKKFGGKSSGPEPYMDMLRKIGVFIAEAPKEKDDMVRLRPIDVLDICNVIGQNVVAGGVRRTAEIALMDADDEEMLHAKDGYWFNVRTQHRNMSNNSVMFWEKPELDYLLALKDSIRDAYEPGFVNAHQANLRRPNFAGFNPCVEILLAPKGFCNLSTVFVTSCLVETKDGFVLDMEKLKRLIKQATRHCMRITNVDIELPEWDKVQKRDRLLGVNLTGCEDAFDACFAGITEEGEDKRKVRVLFKYEGFGEFVYNYEIDFLKEELSLAAQKEADDYAFEMRIPRPLLVTTIQPGGTMSQLRVCSSGFHKSFAPYFIRRVRINSFDALAQTVKQQGYKIYPETAKGWVNLSEHYADMANIIIGKRTGEAGNVLHLANSVDFDNSPDLLKEAVLSLADTWVVEFVVKTPSKSKAADETAISQLNRYFSYQKNWTDHNTSATIQVGDDEWDGVFEELHKRWDDYIGVSFQAKSNDKYDLAPYEAITENEYNEMIAKCPSIDVSLMNSIENGKNSADENLDSACQTGACPTR